MKTVFDAEKLEYISSAGLRVLMKVRKKLNKPVDVIYLESEDEKLIAKAERQIAAVDNARKLFAAIANRQKEVLR